MISNSFAFTPKRMVADRRRPGSHLVFFPLLAAMLLLFFAGRSGAAEVISDGSLRMPAAGDYGAHLLTPSLIELSFVSSPPPGAAPLPLPGKMRAEDFRVTVDGQPVTVAKLGFKRRALYAPLKARDLRVATNVYLELASPVTIEAGGKDKPRVTVTNASSGLWPESVVFSPTAEAQRFNPAIHVNQEGYAPDFSKIAMVGYYLGSLGELNVSAAGEFQLIDARSGESVFTGKLRPRQDAGFTYSPKPYQAVLEADFTDFKTAGEYRLFVPGLGTSLPFRIDEGALMNFARAYALGLYHQRCGCALELPFTRFTHEACHVAPAEVPMPASDYRKAWKIIAELEPNEKNPQQLKSESAQLYPFVRTGKIDTRGGHHDAGDYSKYTTNSATLIHTLIFAVDSLPGVAELDNLGIPESGDGISDVLQEAKWESDFLAKMQDDDGGFYFLVYPKDRRYEGGVTPDHGDNQIVWPKNTAATAAATAALAQCASSPAFKKAFPKEAARYLAAAERGWKFLLAAIEKRGREGAYQRLTHYGDHFQADDDLAWAACELFLATGDLKYEAKLREWYPEPGDPKTHFWSWWHASFSYGAALRSYAFGASSGRLERKQLDPRYLAKCEAELRRAADDAVKWSQQNAYGTSYPEPAKRQGGAGWYFASDQAFDITVGYQLRAQPKYAEAVLANLNFEAGGNPVNVSFITGLGQRRQREIVHQFAQADRRVLPPSGIPLGSLQSGFDYIGPYKDELRLQSFPLDDANAGRFPLYDRWSDAYNVQTEFVINNQARSLASIAFWAAQTAGKSQKWKAAAGKIVLPAKTLALNRPVELRFESPELDLKDARIVWDTRDQEPGTGASYSFTPRSAGPQTIEAEAQWPDGRRVFAQATFSANSPIIFWIEGALPSGAQPMKEGGDDWDWIKPASRPAELATHEPARQHQSNIAAAIHGHGFHQAESPLFVERGDVLFAYVFLDPKNPPKTVMLEWNDGKTMEHRAYWGPNLIPYGKANTPGQRDMGPLPKLGQWVRLEVPASAVGLEGTQVTGMMFRLHSGRATWDAAGKMTKAAKDQGFVAALEKP